MNKMSELVAYLEGGILDDKFGRANWLEANRLTVQRINGELTVVGMRALVIVNIISTDAELTTAQTHPYTIVDTRTMKLWIKNGSAWVGNPWTEATSPYLPGMFVRSAVNSKLFYINADYSLTQIAAG